MRRILIALIALLPTAAFAETILDAPDGWRVIETDKTYETLLTDLKDSVRAENMGLVTEAGPTEVAASRGETIPGNRVVGVFRNDFAVDIIRAAPTAMIEAPIRFMVIEEPEGTATLAWETPTSVFAPYMDAGGDTLEDAAQSLDTIFASIASRATE